MKSPRGLRSAGAWAACLLWWSGVAVGVGAEPSTDDPGVKILVNAKSERYVVSYRQGVEAYRFGDYQGAHQKLRVALDADPRNEELRIMLDKLQSLTQICPNILFLLEQSRGQDATLVRKAVIQYLERDTQQAVDLFKHVLTRQQTNQRLARLLKLAEDEWTAESKGSPTKGRNVVELKMDRALDYFREKKYSQVVVECEEVLVLDPKNALAHKRIGSSLYVLGHKAGAKREWQEAIRLNPNDEGNERLRVLINSIQ